MAERDPLTGLANRRLFDAHFREMVSDGINHAFVSALVLIDLDRFKQVNDHLGHAAGDECLRQVAIRLQKALPDAALIARLGGDEFAVLLRAPLDAAGIARLLKRASLALCRPLAWNGTHMDFGVSIGAAVLRQPPGFKLSNLFNRADAALYAAKAKGGNSVNIDGAAVTVKPSRFGRARIDPPPLTGGPVMP
ncbi:GGDEF domain-containing protein [Hyphomicrobiales bacterium BP6-180914]|uniref:GGDEF domain-containing protein n=2 Tax=Lichenifustis flavocetrariae TaxID=2949735 RepID=A0AA41YWR6_9HYPH|nr:GGDEF domain-containing protein [Lichenifustis flavocetrariae]